MRTPKTKTKSQVAGGLDAGLLPQPDAADSARGVLQRGDQSLVMQTGVVVSLAAAQGAMAVQLDGDVVPVRCAHSCLIEPCVGDEVLLACVARQWWITAVLASGVSKRAVLRVPGVEHLTLYSPHLALQASQSLRLETVAMQVEAQQFDFKTVTARVATTVLQFVAHSMTVMAQQLLTFSDHVSHICRTRTTQVDEMDCLSARHIDVKAEATYSQHAGQVLVTARDTVRLDGDRILMG